MASDRDQRDAALDAVVRRLLDRRAAPDHWDGRLASSALSTATAVLALHTAALNDQESPPRATGSSLDHVVSAGSAWLLQHQNPDGGWGDTIRSRSNLSTTAIVWASLSQIARNDSRAAI